MATSDASLRFGGGCNSNWHGSVSAPDQVLPIESQERASLLTEFVTIPVCLRCANLWEHSKFAVLHCNYET